MESTYPDWTGLPQDLLAAIFVQLEIPDLFRSGAVCTSWHSAYCIFRRLRLPSPKQSPCLLYASDACGPEAATLYFPSTGATFRIPMPDPRLRLHSLSPIGSGHGWLVVADKISNLHLLNPLTGGHVALPPITTFQFVEGSLDDQGNLVYSFSGKSHEPYSLPAVEARDNMYERAVLSCSPSAGSACIVLLMHMPFRELSFARVGDQSWTRIQAGESTGLQWRNYHSDAAYSTADGLFYVVRSDGSMHTLDLNGPNPVATKIMPGAANNSDDPYKYLVQTPWGDLLQAWRFRDYFEPTESLVVPDNSNYVDPRVELNMTDLQLYKVDVHGQRLVKVDSVGDHSLFLGHNVSMCLPVKDFPGLKPNCAYLTDDFFEFINFYKFNKREVGMWSITARLWIAALVAPPLSGIPG
uniref:Uncharacterized protein n=1 Tax=Avena sativa TaxID=4498 RepID=A0ACD5X2N0_AVESA